MKGEVNGRAATILVDSGAQRTIVKASLVNAADYTGESIPITTFILEEAVSRPLANITITTANITLFRQAAVVDDHMMMGSEDVLLSISLGSTEKLADLFLDGEPYMPNPPAMINVTRAQEKRAVAEDEAGAAQESLDDIHPIAIDEAARTDETEEGLQAVEDAIFPDDEQVEESPPLTPTLVNTTQTLDCLLVHPGGITSAELQAAMREDETLQAWRAKADESLDGFYWDDGLLMKTITTNLEEQRELLIMPHEFRPRLLKTAHDRQGHLGVKKVKAALLRRVLWPMLHKDVVQWCLSCDTCQRNRKNKASKAPMMEVPVLAVPFEKVAIDLVGPFERAKSGHRFVLTCIDLASRYPEAIPLRAATAEDVAEALLEIFSRHRLSRTILSDQGHNLTGKLMTQLCERLHIEKIQTSPYHPESNGCVERLHGTLVPMLKKAADSKFQWPLQLKFCLFAIRSTPNRSTGFSPYEVVYGTTMRTPVDLMVDEWMAPKEYSMEVEKWMAELEERLETIRTQVTDNGLLARAQSKRYFDAKPVHESFHRGPWCCFGRRGWQERWRSRGPDRSRYSGESRLSTWN